MPGWCSAARATALAEGLQDALWHLGRRAAVEHRTDSLSAAVFATCGSDADEAEDMTERYGAWRPLRHGGLAQQPRRGARERIDRRAATATSSAASPTPSPALRGSNDFDHGRCLPRLHRRSRRPCQRAPVQGHRGRARDPPRPAGRPDRRLRRDQRQHHLVLGVRPAPRVLHRALALGIGHRLGVRIYDDRLELFLSSTRILGLPRGRARRDRAGVHVVGTATSSTRLKKKPMALLNLVYRDTLFPREPYRRCFERALERLTQRDGLPAAPSPSWRSPTRRTASAELATAIEGALKAEAAPRPRQAQGPLRTGSGGDAQDRRRQAAPGSATEPCSAWDRAA